MDGNAARWRLIKEEVPAATGLHCGRRVGPYVVLDLLGRGGMGEVYRVRRVDAPYEKEVAIKLVRADYVTRYVRGRFRTERQILADLDHPNIARLLDGGETAEGLPYLVMELVEGEPIDSYCDRERLCARDRLCLFRQVCDAVQFAHQRLVIHCDLKTGNILVTHDGTPKLLDFGIAQLLKPPDAAADNTLLIQQTPAYASPEQLRGGPLTPASDVYSLGMVLYEMLTGHLPFRARTGTARGGAPRMPSTALREPRFEQVSALRRTMLDRLRRQFCGDIATIVRTALHRDPRRRYASVQQLSDDIARHLLGVAAAAQRGGWVTDVSRWTLLHFRHRLYRSADVRD